MNKLLPVLLLAIILSGFFACSNEKAALVPENNPCDTTYYALHIRPLIQTHCMGNLSGCHAGGSVNGDFTSYAVVAEKCQSGAFEQRVFIDKDMPASSSLPTLSDSNRDTLQAWYNAGYAGCD